MQSSTLFLVQSSYANTEKQLQRLNALLQTDDAIVIMGEAILHAHLIPTTHKVYVLDSEKQLLTTDIPQVIDYATFAALTLQHSKVIRIA
ncbi:hypothetical protein [Acinetobacter rathckeae]|uniref:hypothetical protein n=1 Tax=Acinetobacter rathckeae TaxID=2605272 RepID=UPI0018A2673D|nr:hypothetical protein [Acinetobacter rathckeae]MBF7687249.1 hypothetical protein [Acinetobacter rathckeae]MBF7694398.1 hypothetical protein [Acinetobacter rathckeae]